MNRLGNQPYKKVLQLTSDGFTVIELLIATVIFSLVLLILTYGVLQITRTYYKGITSTTTQNTSRNVISNISQAVQFGGNGDAPHTIAPRPAAGFPQSKGFCIGNLRFSYLLGYQLVNGPPAAGSTQSRHVLVEDTLPSTCSPATTAAQDLYSSAPLTASSKELMGLSMRLSDLMAPTLGASSDLYNVHIRIVFGDDDLLCSPSRQDCNHVGSNFVSYGNSIPTDLTCKGQNGSQFCAVSDLGTIIEKRVQ